MDLVLVAAAVMVLAVAMYVILDGFDLGIGILFPWVPRDEDRDRMLQSIAPYWDGNETWLVLGGTTLFAGFPLAYSVLLPAWYPGIMLFLAALLFRGVVFEFRPLARRKRIWDLSFAAGSTIATFAQGLVLGSFVQGVNASDGRYLGGPFDFVTPFSLMTGVALLCGYALLGATWLILKTEGALQAWSFLVARWLLLALLFFILVVSVWTTLVQPAIAARWFANLARLSVVPLITVVVAFSLWRNLERGHERWPFALSVALFLLSFAGLAVSLWPYAVPRRYTLWEAAAAPESLGFVLTGVLILLPLVLGYTAHTYRLFRGKARAEHGYH